MTKVSSKVDFNYGKMVQVSQIIQEINRGTPGAEKHRRIFYLCVSVAKHFRVIGAIRGHIILKHGEYNLFICVSLCSSVAKHFHVIDGYVFYHF